MKTCIFDIETFSLYADTGILLCVAMKTYDEGDEVTVIRADDFPTWKRRRSDGSAVCRAVVKAMADYDIFVAHNGVNFDRAMLTSWALKYRLPLFLHAAKFIDPVQLCRRKLRLSRNSLQSLLDFLDVPEEKTHIKWDMWRRAAYDGHRESMNYIVDHCIRDVLALEAAQKRMRKLVKDINDRGSAW